MIKSIKKSILYNLILCISFVYTFTINDLGQSNTNLSEDFLNLNKLNHNLQNGSTCLIFKNTY